MHLCTKLRHSESCEGGCKQGLSAEFTQSKYEIYYIYIYTHTVYTFVRFLKKQQHDFWHNQLKDTDQNRVCLLTYNNEKKITLYPLVAKGIH